MTPRFPPPASRRRRWLTRGALLAVLAVPLAVAASFPSVGGPPQDEPRAAERTVLMRRKLDHAQRILGGLSEGRFGAIARSARSLRELSEVSAGYNLPTEDYRRFSDEFRRLTETLADRAEARDLDGAALTHVQLTLNCVECHKYVRIQTNPPGPPR